jgi:hypothetical protein
VKTRYRIAYRLFRKPLVVLQVEDVQHGSDWQTFERWSSPYWRDATAEDVMNGENDERQA